MRTLLILLASALLLSGCVYQHDSGHSSYGYRDTYRHDVDEYRYYYPYGRTDYPRERIYIIQPSNPCRGNSYRGYCYRYDEDYRRAREYDRSKGYDDVWYQKHRNYCAEHDCSRGRDDDHRKDNNRHDDNRDNDHRNDGQRDQDNRRYQDGRYDNDRRYEDSRRYRDVTPASEDGRYDARDRVIENQQQDPQKTLRKRLGTDGNRESGRREQGQTIHQPRYQGGEDRVADPKPDPRVEAGSPENVPEQTTEHGNSRPDDSGQGRGHEGMNGGMRQDDRPAMDAPGQQGGFEPPVRHDDPPIFEEPRGYEAPPVRDELPMHEPERPVFAEPPRESRPEPVFEPPVREEPPMMREEPPMMREEPRMREEPMIREPEPAFEPPARHEEPPPRQEPERRRPAEEPEQAMPAPVDAPPAEAPPVQ